MIAKNKKGKSFGGCVRYVMNEGAEVLAAEGVLADNAASIIRDFAVQRSGRPEIKQPVGHIAVAFSPEDSPRMTGDFMLTLAHEYMAEMGICNTQYIIVRHHNTDHDHFHIVYNRIDNDLKLISVNNDYRRNVVACKKLKDRHGLTYGTGKEKVNRLKLAGADKVKYQIYDEIAVNLPKCATYSGLEQRLRQAGITVQYKYRRGAEESPENIQGVSFEKGGITFKGSDIDRKFSHANLKKALSVNLNEVWEKMKHDILPEVKPRTKPSVAQPEQAPPPVSPLPPAIYRHSIRGVEVTDEQWETLLSGGHIYLENMERKNGNGKFSAYVFLNDDKSKRMFSTDDPDRFVRLDHYHMRVRDKMQVEKGYVTHVQVRTMDRIGSERCWVWKDAQTDEIMTSSTDPRPEIARYEQQRLEFERQERNKSASSPESPKQQEREKQAPENCLRQPPAVNRIPPAVNRTSPPKRTVPPPSKGPKFRR
jgi:hypothetical protein